MQTPSARLLLVAVVLGLTLPGLPLVRGEGSASVSLGGSGPVWVSARATTPGGPLNATLHVDLAGEGGIGVSLYVDGRWAYTATLAVLSGHPGVLVEAGEPTAYAAPVHVDTTTAADEAIGIDAEFDVPAGHDSSFVVWTAGTVQAWSLQTTAPPEDSLVALEQGSSAYFLTARDFQGPLNADVTQDAQATQVMARASASASASFVVQHEVLGTFSTGLESQTGDVLSVHGPSGGFVGCPCFWAQEPGVDSTPNGPGAWTFEDTGAGAGAPVTAQTYLFFADAPVLR